MPNRRFDRIRFESRAIVNTAGESFEGLTENLSLNGLFIRTGRNMPVGNRVEVMFSLPSASRSSTITVKSTVVRNNIHGMAFQFGSLDEDSFSRLHTVIKKSPNLLKEYNSA